MSRVRPASWRPSGWAAAVWLLALVVAAAAGAGVASILWYLQTPAEVSQTAADPYWPVTAETTTDPRSVTLELAATSAPELATPLAGTITALKCRIGGRVTSGSVVMTVDGRRIVAVATRVPLWRDLSPGDSGPDVRAWQALLDNVGLPASRSGVFDAATSKATTEFARTRALAWPEGRVPIDAVVWLPASRATISACVQQLGKVVAEGDLILRLEPTLERVTLRGDSAGPVLAGARDLVIGDATVPLGPANSVSSPLHLAELQATPIVQAALRDPNIPVMAVTQLHEPTSVASVPPSTLVGIEGSSACVIAASGSVHPVKLLASSLGRVEIAFVSDPWPAEVQLAPTPHDCGHR